MPPGDVHTVTTFFDFQGNLNNVYLWHFVVQNDATSGTNEAAMIEFFEDDMLPTLAIGLDENFIFTCIDAKRILDQLVKDKISSIGEQKAVAIPGTIMAAEALPGQCSLVIQTIKDLDDASTSSRGRDFFTGFPEGDQADGIWTDAAQDRVTGQLNSEFTQGAIVKNGGTFIWSNLSGKLYAARKVHPGPVFPAITNQIVFLRPLNHVRTQRRRQSLNPCDKYGTVVDMS